MSRAPFKYILLMIVIAVLFSIFVNSLANAFMERPSYEDYCASLRYAEPVMTKENISCTLIQPTKEEASTCTGYMEPEYDEQGCISSYTCNTCSVNYEEAQASYNLYIFLFMSIIGIITILVTLLIEKEGVLAWILNGLLVGGLISLFVGTIIYFDDASRILRPLIMLAEILIVIVVAYKKLENKK